MSSGVASIGARGGRVPPWQRKNCQKLGKREEKSGRNGQNREGSFTLPLLTNRASYTTDYKIPIKLSCTLQLRYCPVWSMLGVYVWPKPQVQGTPLIQVPLWPLTFPISLWFSSPCLQKCKQTYMYILQLWPHLQKSVFTRPEAQARPEVPGT